MQDTAVSHGVVAAARRLAERNELASASMEEIAREAGITRVTLYRRGETRATIIAALHAELVHEERERLLPIVTASGNARTRLERVLEALCEMTDSRAGLITGLDAATLNAIYHGEGEETLTRPEFIGPIVRLLYDGAADGSLRTFAEPDAVATVLYTQVSYTYLHLRQEHRWSAKRATAAVTDLTVGGLLPPPIPTSERERKRRA